MAGWDDVRRIALALPEVEEGVRFGTPVWRVGQNGFLWERPLRARDREELGDAAPEGAILGASTADVNDKLALLNEDAEVFFTTAHFEGHTSILVVLDRIDRARLEELAVEAWLARAPKRLVRGYLSRLER